MFAEIKYRSQIYCCYTGVSTMSGIIHEVCEALYKVLQPIYLKPPTTPQEWSAVADSFYDKWNYPNCVGAIDGKHIVLVKPNHAGSKFHNYKTTESVVLMAIADANQKFLYVDIGENGRMSDGGVWKDCLLSKAL